MAKPILDDELLSWSEPLLWELETAHSSTSVAPSSATKPSSRHCVRRF
jgi:hypothetical protein